MRSLALCVLFPALACACAKSTRPAPDDRERGPCVTHWVSAGIGQPSDVPLVYENRPKGPGAASMLLAERETSGGDRGYVVETAADVTGDGVRDLALRDWYPGSAIVCEPVGVTLFEGDRPPVAAWSTQHAQTADCHAPLASLAALGDWNGDGIDDLVAQGYVFVRGAAGTLEADDERCGKGAALGDVDADGFRDSGCIQAGADGMLIAWGGPGRARDQLSVAAIGGKTQRLDVLAQAGDLNRDGHADFVAYDYAERYEIVLGGDRLSLRVAASFSPPGGGRMRVLPVFDVDGDGFDDLAIISEGQASLLRGQRSWSADDTQPWLSPFYTSDKMTPAGDADCDGIADVLVHRAGALGLHLGSPAGPKVTPLWSREGRLDLTPLYASGD